jgi:hypothetical protein
VTVNGVRFAQNKKHQVTGITVSFDGAVNAAEAANTAIYQLTMAGTKGSFDARNAKRLPLSAAAYDDALHQVVLKPRKAFALTKPVELLIQGKPPGGLQDTTGRFIDGDGDGSGADDGAFVLNRKGAAREDIAVSSSPGSRTIRAVSAAVTSNAAVLMGITTPPEAQGVHSKKWSDREWLS